jgi:hypothetical protein
LESGLSTPFLETALAGSQLPAGIHEAGQPNLDRPRIVVPCVCRKIRVQPLGKRCEPLDALRPVKESGRSGDDEVEARVSPRINLVDQLP